MLISRARLLLQSKRRLCCISLPLCTDSSNRSSHRGISLVPGPGLCRLNNLSGWRKFTRNNPLLLTRENTLIPKSRHLLNLIIPPGGPSCCKGIKVQSVHERSNCQRKLNLTEHRASRYTLYNPGVWHSTRSGLDNYYKVFLP